MNTRPIPWSKLAGGLLVAVAGSLILRSVIQGPMAVAQPTPAIAEAARTRTVVPNGGPDERASRLEGDWVAGLGVVEPADREIRVAASAAGRIAALLVREGQLVKAGQPLARLDNEAERAALAAATGEVAVAEAEYHRLLKGLRAEDVQAVIAEAEAQQVRLALAEATLRRTRSLAASAAVSPAQLDDARHAVDAAKATLAVLEAKRRAAVAGTRPEDLQIGKARVEAARGRLEQARWLLRQRTVQAPVAGTVMQIKARPGEYYSPQNPNQEAILVLGDMRKLRVRVDVDERDIGALALGAKAQVTADAFPGIRFAGKVVEIGQRMGRKNIRTDDPIERIDTKVLETVLELDDPSRLKPGLRVWAYIAPQPDQVARHAGR